MYKVSVVVVVYNTEKFLGECFDSIFNQTLDGVEVVVVDNASEEGTRIALEEKLKGHDNVVHRRMETNVGGATGATVGIGMASGEYLYVMDSDDILPENALKALYDTAVEKDCDVVVGRAVSLFKGRVTTLRFAIDEITWAKELITDSLEKNPQLMVAPFFWGKLYRRSFIVDNSIYMKDGVINADRYMTTKALKLSSRTAVIRDITCIWRRHTKKSGNKSVTMTSREIASIRDRMESLTDTAMLFPEGELRQYALISNLARVFLPVRALKNAEIRSEYAKLIEQYLDMVDEQKMIESTVLPIHYKVYAYLARRKRYKAIIRLSSFMLMRSQEKTKENRRASGTYEPMPLIFNVPREVRRVRTVRKWNKVASRVENGELHIECKVSDTSLCKAEAIALYVENKKTEMINECDCPVSTYKSGDKGAVLSFATVLSEESVAALLKKGKCSRLYLEAMSGDTVFRTEIPLTGKTLAVLRKRTKNSDLLANPRVVVIRNKLSDWFEPVRNIFSIIKRIF